MNIRQALKQKSKLLTEIKELYKLVQTSNSLPAETPKRFNVSKLLDDISALTLELVELKSKIHKANQPVYEKIFLMAELKGKVKQLRGVSTEEGIVSSRYGSTQETKVAQVNAADMRTMIKNIEKQIETLQEELDVHNSVTQI